MKIAMAWALVVPLAACGMRASALRHTALQTSRRASPPTVLSDQPPGGHPGDVPDLLGSRRQASANCGSAGYIPPPAQPGSWIYPDPETARTGKIKLALLINVESTVWNSALWSVFFKQAVKDGTPFSVFIHVFGARNDTALGEFAKYAVDEVVFTMWCDMVRAEDLLIRRALDDPNVTHLIMLSHNSVPVKSLRQIYKELRAQPSSRFCADDDWYWPRAESWWVMRRWHAHLMYNHSQELRYSFAGDCYDEQAFYLPLRRRAEQFGKSELLKKECVVFTEWNVQSWPCKEWRSHSDLCKCPTLRLHIRDAGDSGHPATFMTVSDIAMTEMIQSPFWFARKFTPGAFTDQALKVAELAWA